MVVAMVAMVARTPVPRLPLRLASARAPLDPKRTSRTSRASEEVCLLHDPQELLLVHLPVAVAVRLVDHLLELLVRHALAQLLGDALQVLEAALFSIAVVEQAERLQDLVLRVAV